MLECDDFFLKFLDAFKKFKASEQAAAWVADGTLVFEVRLCVYTLCVSGRDRERLVH